MSDRTEEQLADKCPKHFYCLPEPCGDCPESDLVQNLGEPAPTYKELYRENPFERIEKIVAKQLQKTMIHRTV